jgi:para-nitrobenzyl esterase
MVPDYYGNRIASRSQVVFVSLNFRLGPLGWFTSPALRDGASREDASGNYGTLDIIQALQWIRQNIAAFGGDPDLVTITGESAGGVNVLSMLIAPPAKGLFQRAMSESGGARTSSVADGDASSRAVLEQLLVRDGRAPTRASASAVADSMSPEQVRAYLRSKTDRQILRCYSSAGLGMIGNPAIFRDGAVIAADGFDALRTGEYPGKVPVILGSNREELKLFLTFSGAVDWRSDLFSAEAKYGSQRWKVSGVDEVARRLASNPDQPPVYAYEFAWGAPDAKGRGPLPGTWGKKLGAFHSLEIPFFLGTDTLDAVFHLLLFTKQNEPGRKALSAAMMDYLAQFARTGNPNRDGSGLPAWTAWTNEPGAPKSIVFDVNGNSPAIRMSSVELTDDGVLAAAAAELPEPVRSQTLRYLEGSHMASGVR